MAKASGTLATVALTAAKVDFALHTYDGADHEGGYGEAAARQLGIDPRRLFKTLLAKVDGKLVVAMVPVCGQLDLKALAHAAGGKKAVMATPEEAQRSTGMVVGGISPLGQRTPLPTFADASATQWEHLVVSAGKRGLQIEVAAADLLRLTDATLAPLSKP